MSSKPLARASQNEIVTRANGELRPSATETATLNGLTESMPLNVVMDSIREAFALLDTEFRIVDVNAEALRLHGCKRQDLIGKTHWEAFPGSEDSELGQLYKIAMCGRQIVSLEHQHHWVDGRALWLEMRAYPVDGGGLALFFRDVGERQRINQRLSESEARFRAAIDATQGVLWTNDAEGRMMGEQPGWAKLTGQSFEDYQGYGWSAAVHPEDVQPTIDAWNAVVAAPRTFVFEHRVRRHDGKWRRFAIRAIPVLNEGGHIREWVGVHRDITEATEVRLQLARNAQTFKSLVRNSPFGIYVIDGAFKLFEFSQGAAKVFANINPLIGRDFAQIQRILWPENFAKAIIARFRTTLETGEPYISVSTIEARANIDATEAYDWRIERISLPDGSHGVVCYFYDLSERMRLENELRAALADKELLAREIEHRVQNSLTIVGSLLNMQRASTTNTETKDALAAAAARVLAIGRVHQRLYKGKDIGWIEFGAYLRQLCEDIEQTLGSSRISFEVQTDTVELHVNNAVPLGIASNELITNASKYCGRGADEHILVTLASQGEVLVLTVSNTGPGVPTDFSPDGSKGMGLRVIKVLVRQVGGTIVYPTAGSEARFEIRVPIGSEGA